MRHLTDTERSLITLGLRTSATRWSELAAEIATAAPGICGELRKQAEQARKLALEIDDADGVATL